MATRSTWQGTSAMFAKGLDGLGDQEGGRHRARAGAVGTPAAGGAGGRGPGRDVSRGTGASASARATSRAGRGGAGRGGVCGHRRLPGGRCGVSSFVISVILLLPSRAPETRPAAAPQSPGSGWAASEGDRGSGSARRAPGTAASGSGRAERERGPG